MTTVSAPSKGGYQRTFDSLSDALAMVGELLGLDVDDITEVLSPDGGTVYCYASQADADADRDGSYAVAYRIHETEPSE
jgi:hypothetical protein